MSYKAFIPNIWDKSILEGLKKALVFADNTYNVYSGVATKKGESITFNVLGDVTIHDELNRESANGTIANAEELEAANLVMPINQFRYYNVSIGDVDEMLSNPNLSAQAKERAVDGLKDKIDQYIADLSTSSEVEKITASSLSKSNVLDFFDQAVQKLYEHNVGKDTYVEAIITPKIHRYLKQAYVDLDTNNSEMMKNGYCGRYGNIVFKMSNNTKKATISSTEHTYVQVRTKRAIGFALTKMFSEAYRQNNAFGDALRGYALFDAKILIPEEMVVLDVTF